MGFIVKRKLDLSFLGDDWHDCYIEFRAPSYKEVKEIAKIESKTIDGQTPPDTGSDADIVVNTLKDHIIAGKGYDPDAENGKTDIDQSNFENLPPQVISKSVELLLGDPDPKS